MDLLLIVILLVFSCSIGSITEKNHYKKIKKREIQLYNKPYISFHKNAISKKKKVRKSELVSGCCVISSTYFKDFISSIKTFFGGKMTPYESLLDRARREAILRMRESAYGASGIMNVKVESCILSDQSSKGVPQIAMIAYGTAVTYER